MRQITFRSDLITIRQQNHINTQVNRQRSNQVQQDDHRNENLRRQSFSSLFLQVSHERRKKSQ